MLLNVCVDKEEDDDLDLLTPVVPVGFLPNSSQCP